MNGESSVIETVAKQGTLSLRRLLARHMARTAGKTVMSPENPRQIARKRMDAGADRLPTPDDIRIEQIEVSEEETQIFLFFLQQILLKVRSWLG